VPLKVTAQEEGRAGDRCGERHSNNGLNQHLAGSTGVAAYRFNGFHANHTDTDSGSGTANGALQAVMEVSFDCSDYFDHFICFCGLF
jgi:hypothetical protein